MVINFEVNNEIINNETDLVTTSYQFLMLSPHKAIDLNKFGNKECEFSVLSANSNKVLLTFSQPSKLIANGRCAAGLEKGFIYLELNKNSDLINSTTYLIESCLWSIETINNQDLNSEIKIIECENLQTSEAYNIIINTKEATIIKKK